MDVFLLQLAVVAMMFANGVGFTLMVVYYREYRTIRNRTDAMRKERERHERQ
jgi:hypothetical protein